MKLTRRTLLKTGASAPMLLSGAIGLDALAQFPSPKGKGLQADVAVIGGGLGGCAAALAALRSGQRVVLSEPTDWIGGQSTSQAVPFDEHKWIEKVVNPSYARLVENIRGYYRRNYPLTEAAAGNPTLNPGFGSVSRICAEPRVVLAALEEMLAPYRSAGRLVVLLGHRPTRANMEGDRIRSVLLEDTLEGGAREVASDYFLDATELGDLLPLAGVEHVTGAESKAETGELHAPDKALPDNHQAFTVCFAMDHLPGEDHSIDRPSDYDFWRAYIPELTPPWTGPQLALRATHPVTLQPRDYVFDPPRESKNEIAGLWRYRRIFFAGHHREGFAQSDICLVNWPMNDYWLGNLIGNSPEQAAEHLRRGKQLSLSLLYWLQTEAPRADGGLGWKGLRPRGDIVGTEDGLAKHPYIRESRRIRALVTVREQDVGKEARAKATGAAPDQVTAADFEDSIGVGYYRIDLHPSSGGDNYIDIDSLRFQIPLGALIPVRARNLLAACKNIGTTHITNGCYRLHPVEWNIGEAAGLLASWCRTRGLDPQQVHSDKEQLKEFQSQIAKEGIPICWPEV
ncbi:MAG: hypothetical protein GHCLOJNM_03788 [bacterium]|nr:hypothetical protein [bacterium]